MYVYVQSEPGLFTVGFYDPAGLWWPDADFGTREQARNRGAFLNGNIESAAAELVLAARTGISR